MKRMQKVIDSLHQIYNAIVDYQEKSSQQMEKVKFEIMQKLMTKKPDETEKRNDNNDKTD